MIQTIPEQPKTTAVITIHVVVTSAKINTVEQSNDYRLKFRMGGITEHLFELRDSEGNLLPIGTSDPDDDSGHFAVPIAVLNGAVIDSLELDFVAGKATLKKTWDTAGEFVITEDLINTYIENKVKKFVFNGLAFSVHQIGE